MLTWFSEEWCIKAAFLRGTKMGEVPHFNIKIEEKRQTTYEKIKTFQAGFVQPPKKPDKYQDFKLLFREQHSVCCKSWLLFSLGYFLF